MFFMGKRDSSSCGGGVWRTTSRGNPRADTTLIVTPLITLSLPHAYTTMHICHAMMYTHSQTLWWMDGFNSHDGDDVRVWTSAWASTSRFEGHQLDVWVA